VVCSASPGSERLRSYGSMDSLVYSAVSLFSRPLRGLSWDPQTSPSAEALGYFHSSAARTEDYGSGTKSSAGITGGVIRIDRGQRRKMQKPQRGFYGAPSALPSNLNDRSLGRCPRLFHLAPLALKNSRNFAEDFLVLLRPDQESQGVRGEVWLAYLSPDRQHVPLL